MKGGVEDEGNFKEGFCFKLSFVLDGKKQFVVCADELNVKEEWMEAIIQTKTIYDNQQKNKPYYGGLEVKEEGTV